MAEPVVVARLDQSHQSSGLCSQSEGAQGKQSRPGPGTANIQLKCRAGFVVESESGDGVIILN